MSKTKWSNLVRYDTDTNYTFNMDHFESAKECAEYYIRTEIGNKTDDPVGYDSSTNYYTTYVAVPMDNICFIMKVRVYMKYIKHDYEKIEQYGDLDNYLSTVVDIDVNGIKPKKKTTLIGYVQLETK